MTTAEEIQKLEKRKEMAVFQRKITTQIWTVFEYDQEIEAIDRRLSIYECLKKIDYELDNHF